MTCRKGRIETLGGAQSQRGHACTGTEGELSAVLELGLDGWITLLVVAGATYVMAREKLGPDIIMFASLAMLVVAGILSPSEAFVGYAQPAVVTIGALFVCAAAVQQTGALNLISGLLFGQTTRVGIALPRLLIPTAFLSAFMNNTPIVVMFIPMVRKFARKIGASPSTFLMPLAYASMLGGTCTLMGTSPNLVVSGMLEERGLGSLGVFEQSKLGIPTVIVAIGFLLTIGRWLVPQRRELSEIAHEDQREYLAEVEVADDSPLVGQTVEQAGLRNLPGLFLIEIRRSGGGVVRPVARHMVVKGGDHLVFTGLASTVSDLTQLPGLVPVDETPNIDREIFEVVVSHRSPLIGLTVKQANFRRRFDAAILAVHRAGTRIAQKIGEIRLEPGDTLMLLAAPGFRQAWQDNASFYLVSAVDAPRPPAYTKANLTLLTLGGIVLIPAFSDLPLVVTALAGVVFLIATECISGREARESVNWSVLLLVGSAFGMAAALEKTGAAATVSQLLIEVTGPFGPRATLAGVYVLGAVFASFISNAAAAALVFPVAMAAAETSGLNPRAFAIALAMAASAGFATPIGSQPNLLVYGPGGYRYRDFVRVGLPLTILCMVITVLLLPMFWPLALDGVPGTYSAP